MQAENVTQYLSEAKEGNVQAHKKVYELVYDNLKNIAHQRLYGYQKGETFNTTALVHEAYLKLINMTDHDFQNRAHFYAVASRAMRFILVDYIRSKMAQKRGGSNEDKNIADISVAVEERLEEFITLHMALNKLMEKNERLGRLVEYRFIGGMTYEEISEVTGYSEPTLKRDWARARTWLYSAMKDEENS